MNYWIGKSGQRLGPYSEADVQRMIREGSIAGTDLAWKEGMAAWAPVSEVIPAPAQADFAKPQPPAAQYQPPQPAAPAPASPAGPAYGGGAPAASPAPASYSPAPASYSPSPASSAGYSGSPSPSAYSPPPAAQPQWGSPPGQQYAPPPATPYAPYSPAPAGTMGGPIPNGVHWAVLLIPFVGLVFYFIQISFIKKIDPQNPSLKFFLIGLGLYILYFPLAIGGALAGNEVGAVVALVGALCGLGAAVCILVSVFKMRSSLVRYYNTVEPIGLRLSGVMTFFFNVMYFQYHFTRINKWKTTGQLEPQS